MQKETKVKRVNNMQEKCSERQKKRLAQKDESYHMILILLIGIIGTAVWMIGYCLVWLIASLFDLNNNVWMGYLIAMVISIVLFIISVLMLKKVYVKRQIILRKMGKCKCKPKEKALDLI